MRRRNLPYRSLLAFGFLTLLLSGIGLTYAGWSDQLYIESRLTSGSFSAVFEDTGDYRVYIAGPNGEQVSGSADGGQITFQIASHRRSVEITAPDRLLLSELGGQQRFLAVQYPIGLEEESTVRSLRELQPDLNLSAQETLKLETYEAVFRLKDKEYSLPADLAGLETELAFDLYRQVEQVDGQALATVFLKLTPDSLEFLQEANTLQCGVEELPVELTEAITPTGDGSSGQIQGELHVTYRFSVPLYLEQG